MPPIDFNGLDTVVHGPVRLGVLTALQTGGPLDFTTLKKRLDVGDGVLGLHLRKLEETGYLTCKKAFVGRRPKSTYRITTSDFAAAVEHASRRIECIPGACGFPRVRDLDAAALDWTALEERVTAALLPTFEIEESQGQRALPEEWVPGSACRLGCGGALRTPDALAAHF